MANKVNAAQKNSFNIIFAFFSMNPLNKALIPTFQCALPSIFCNSPPPEKGAQRARVLQCVTIPLEMAAMRGIARLGRGLDDEGNKERGGSDKLCLFVSYDEFIGCFRIFFNFENSRACAWCPLLAYFLLLNRCFCWRHRLLLLPKLLGWLR